MPDPEAPVVVQYLPSFPEFSSTDSATSAVEWEKYIKRLERLFCAININNSKKKRDLLLYYVGDEINDIFASLENTGEDYETAKTKLHEHFNPKRNVEYHRCKFGDADQFPDESIIDYYVRLQKLAGYCEFTDKAPMIKTQLLRGTKSRALRRKAIRDDLTLKQIVDSGRAAEITDDQTSDLDKSKNGHVNYVGRSGKGSYKQNMPKRAQSDAKQAATRNTQAKSCYHCGGPWPHTQQCPALGQRCRKCHKMNHFARCCQGSGTVNQVSQDVNKSSVTSKKQTDRPKDEVPTDSDSSEVGYAFGLSSENVHSQNHDHVTSDSDVGYTFGLSHDKPISLPNVKVTFGDQTVQVYVDSCSTVTLLNKSVFEQWSHPPELTEPNKFVYAYGSTEPIPLVGMFTCTISHNGHSVQDKVYVSESGMSLLSFATSQALGLVQITCGVSTSVDHIVEQYSDRYTGVGKLTEVTAKLHIDDSVMSVVQPHRRIPFHLRKKLGSELTKLQELDIIEPVGDSPTPWVSPVHVVNKPNSPGEIRMCVDMRMANQAIARERHLTPTMDDIVTSLNGATVFSKLDLNAGYHQIELAEESRQITVFSTHIGLFRFKRLSFGINSSAEIFQNYIQSALAGLDGVLNISDDILVYGSTQEEHDTNLQKCLQRIRERNLTLNRKKCQYSMNDIEFFGHVFSQSGVSPSPKKVEALKLAARPQNKQEVKSLLGLANYCARFIPNLATTSQPLRDLTKDSSTWEWTEIHEIALQNLKASISANCSNAYFDISKNTTLLVDASPVGLAAILVQHDNDNNTGVVAGLASRSLTSVEQRYSQTEREALGIYWGIVHFHLYLYGSSFQVVTDHKPLLPMFNKPLLSPPLRIERWLLKLQEYDFEVVYEKGKYNPADYMSRHPIETANPSHADKVAEEFVNLITYNAIPKTLTIDDVQAATESDDLLQRCMVAIQTNDWHRFKTETAHDQVSEAESLYTVREELSANIQLGIILRNHRIVVPKELRQQVVSIAHEGHQGIVKTKQLLREKVWFPGIDKLVESTVRNCLACQVTVSEKRTKEPLHMSDLPQAPWQEVSVDFKELSCGEYLLVVVDNYSRFPIVEVVQSTSAKTVIPKLDTIFSTHGIPAVVQSDNGPPFNSTDFAQFAKHLGFVHRKITPLWPQANGEVERMMRNLKKIYNASKVERKSWRQQLNAYLRNYRATPHSTTQCTPASLFLGRQFMTRLPEITKSVEDKDLRQRDKTAKAKIKHYADKKRVRGYKLQIGDKVFVKNTGRFASMPYQEEIYEVTSVKGTMVSAKHGQRVVTRNSSYFKLYKGQNFPSDAPDFSDDESLTDEQEEPQVEDQPAVPLRRNPRRNRQIPQKLNEYILDV